MEEIQVSPHDVARKLAVPAGIVEMTESEYNAHPAVRNSDLGYLLRSPAHYRAHKAYPPAPTDAMEFGTAAHFAVLEPKKFYDRYEALPENPQFKTDKGTVAVKPWATKEGQAYLDAVRQRGKHPLSHDDFQSIERIVEAVYSHPTASKYLSGGVAERAFVWTDPDTGIECKAKPDYLRAADGIYVDLKIMGKPTESATVTDFAAAGFRRGCHRQSAFYVDGLKAVTGNTAAGTVFIAVEAYAPYGIGVFLLDDAAVDAGRGDYKRALITLAGCRKTNQWPGYPTETQVVGLPRWMK